MFSSGGEDEKEKAINQRPTGDISEFTLEELSKATSKLKNRKALRLDQIANGVLRVVVNETRDSLEGYE